MERTTREAVEKTLDALFKLEELRQIWRDTAPTHELLPEQSAQFQGALKSGLSTGLTFLELLMQGPAAALEEMAERADSSFDVTYRFVRRPTDVDLFVPETAVRHITGSRRKMGIVGPVFAGVKAKIASPGATASE